MLSNSITDQENALFNEWRKKRPVFQPDGVVNEAVYLASIPKIVYLLKETNNPNFRPDNDLRSFLANECKDYIPTWNNIVIWTYGIRKMFADNFKIVSWQEIERNFKGKTDGHMKQSMLNTIAAVNIKKEPGGAAANTAELKRISYEDSEFISQQLAIYKPDLVISCGSQYPNGGSLHWKVTSRGIWYAYDAGTVVIGFVHPAWRKVNANFMFYPLMDAVKEIWQTGGENHS